jgi:pimeloyl-ACP methyl ester carboxylesterase
VLSGSYDALLAALAKYDVHVVAFDLPGFGFSRPSAPFDFSIEKMTDVVIELLLALRHSTAVPTLQFALALPCVSGHAAVRVAARRTDLVHSLISIQTACVRDQLAWVKRLDPTGALQTPVDGQEFNRQNAAAISTGWFKTAAASAESSKEFDAVSQAVGVSLARSLSLGKCQIGMLLLW